jgi:hypothetical protein
MTNASMIQCDERYVFRQKKIETITSYRNGKMFEIDGRKIRFVRKNWKMMERFDFLERGVGVVLSGMIPNDEEEGVS